jgi:UDP-N-acetyl-D-galactosamine dehydrogenase
MRNSRVVDIVTELQQYGTNVDVYDPWISREDAFHEYGIQPIEEPAKGAYDAIIVAVSHRQFAEMGADALHALGKDQHVVYDLKYVLPADASDLRL